MSAASRARLMGLVLWLPLAPSPSPAPAPGSGEPRAAPWRVLVLHGADFYIPGSVVQDEALRASLTEAAGPRLVAFRAEALDAVSFDSTHHEPEVFALLAKKHRGLRFDVVMPLGDVALGFAERHRAALWPGAPIVFFSVSGDRLLDHPPAANVTGITIDFDERGSLALARRLQPDATRLVLVAGASEYDRYWWPRLREAAGRGAAGLEVVESFGRPMRSVIDSVSRLDRRSIVLYTTISRDGDGQQFQPRIVAEQLSRLSQAPLYSIFETQVGYGVVGGSIASLAAQGRQAAALALRVLRGEPPDSIPVAPPGPPTAVVDWRQLRRWGLSPAALPAGATVLFRRPSLWEEYWEYVVAAALALTAQAGLIVALLAQLRRRRLAEAEATRQRAELAHAARLSAVGELTASIAHEINQPLGAILSNAEAAELFLEADPPMLERVRQILRDIRDEDHRASAVIREVRAFARKSLAEARRLSLNEVVEDVIPLVQADARRRGVELETQLASGLPQVRGDRVQLQQVVLNLTLNGLEALAASSPDERRLRVRTRANDARGVELVVSDTGPGIPEQLLPRLFESFFTTKPEGLGLGLSIVRSIVEAHGGGIRAENEAGGGASFRVVLPVDGSGPVPPREV